MPPYEGIEIPTLPVVWRRFQAWRRHRHCQKYGHWWDYESMTQVGRPDEGRFAFRWHCISCDQRRVTTNRLRHLVEVGEYGVVVWEKPVLTYPEN